MCVFIAGLHKAVDVIAARKIAIELGFQTGLVSVDGAVGFRIPTINKEDLNCLIEFIEDKIKQKIITTE